METTESKYVNKFIRVNLPEPEELKKLWRDAESKELTAIKQEGYDSDGWPEGAISRKSNWGGYALYVCHPDGGRVDGFEPSYGDHAKCVGEGAIQHIADVALQAYDDADLAMNGFTIFAESRLYWSYLDEDRITVPTDQGCLDEDSGYSVDILVYTHTPVKATDENLRMIQAYQHFCFYIDLNHMRESNIWEPWLFQHFYEKLKGIMSRTQYDYVDPGSIVRWVQEMSSDNQRKLFDYILVHHIDRY